MPNRRRRSSGNKLLVPKPRTTRRFEGEAIEGASSGNHASLCNTHGTNQLGQEFWWLIPSLISKVCYLMCANSGNGDRYKELRRKVFSTFTKITKFDFKALKGVDFLQQNDIFDEIFKLDNTKFNIGQRLKIVSVDTDLRFISKAGSSQIHSNRFHVDFIEPQLLGCGAFGKVFKARYKVDSKFYAIKHVPLNPADAEKSLRESYLLSGLDHSNVVRYHTSWVDSVLNDQNSSDSDESVASSDNKYSRNKNSNVSENCSFVTFRNDVEVNRKFGKLSIKEQNYEKVEYHESVQECRQLVLSNPTPMDVCQLQSPTSQSQCALYIQMELCSETLANWLDNRNDSDDGIDDELNRKYFKQICKAVEYIHDKGIIHRDLKPSNIMFDYSNEKVKICDFGLACRFVNCHEKNVATSEAGTHYYMSPEMLEGKKFSQKTDIYSLGVILYQLYTSFKTKTETYKMLRLLRLHYFDAMFMTDWPLQHTILSQMINSDETERPDASDILCSQLFFNKADIISKKDDEIAQLKKTLRHKNFIISGLNQKIEQLTKHINMQDHIIAKRQILNSFAQLLSECDGDVPDGFFIDE